MTVIRTVAFDARDPGQLASALSRALTDTTLRTSLSQRGVERAQTFTWDHAALETIKAYLSIETRQAKHSTLPHIK